MATEPNKLAAWVLTANGLALAQTLAQHWPALRLYCPRRLADGCDALMAQPFERLTDAVATDYENCDGHIFIMATGIVVRVIAPLLRHKSVDPAVVAVDDAGRFAISLISGHIGGANRLAAAVAAQLGAVPVITTATDCNGRPAVDTEAVARGLKIENPAAIKKINMALLTGEPVPMFDPFGWLAGWPGDGLGAAAAAVPAQSSMRPDGMTRGILVDDRGRPLSPEVLVLRPPSLVAGIGCNRNASAVEIGDLLRGVLAAHGLSVLSLAMIASIDLKQDEVGLLSLAETLALPLVFHSRDALNQVRQVPNPSPMAAKHIGVHSVCEAAALLSAGSGTLIVPKQKSAKVTVAVARRPSSSSASAPAI